MHMASKLHSWLMAFLGLVTVLILVVLTASVFTSVVVRYLGLFQGSMPWIDELSRYLSIWLVFLGSVVALDQGKHVAADFLLGLIPERVRPWLSLFVQLCVLVFLAVLTREGMGLAQRTTRQITPALGLPISYVYLAIPVSSVLMIIGVLGSMLESIQALRLPPAKGERNSADALER